MEVLSHYSLHAHASTQQTVTCKKESPLYWAEIAVSIDGKAVGMVDKGGYLWGGTPDFKVVVKACIIYYVTACTCTFMRMCFKMLCMYWIHA